MVIGIGIDVASVARIEAAIERYGARFVDRVLTAAERAALAQRRDRATALAGRWAAKEAAIKAFSGRGGALFHDFELVREPSGAPTLSFHGKAQSAAHALGVTRAFVSITHDAGVAAAVVVLEGA